jgi:hypothetical protein
MGGSLSLIIALFVGLVGISIAGASTRATDQLPILFPAQVPPEVGECSTPITTDVDGNVSPLFCGSRINVRAWRAFVRLSSQASQVPGQVNKYQLFKLHRNSPLSMVKRAICKPQPGDNPIYASEYRLASAYFGWHFKFNALAWVATGHCASPSNSGAA